MPIYRNVNDTLEGKKIYCVFERGTKPSLVSTKGRHNAQRMKIEGNPAIATIIKPLRYIKD